MSTARTAVPMAKAARTRKGQRGDKDTGAMGADRTAESPDEGVPKVKGEADPRARGRAGGIGVREAARPRPM